MGSIAAVPHKPSAQSIETRQPHDRNHEAQVVLPVEAADWQRGSGLRLDVLSKLQALRFSHLGADLGDSELRPPFQPDEETPPFPVWLWELRASALKAGMAFALEARTAAFWHSLYLEGIEPRITAVVAWCKGEDGEDIAEYAVMLAVILVIVVGTVRLIGSNANNVFSNVASSVQ
jgi:Flp pilus assembly pilin Flp